MSLLSLNMVEESASLQKTEPLPTENISSPPSDVNLADQFIEFLDLDAGDGKVSPDTVATYRTQIKLFLEYCQEKNLDPLKATRSDIQAYRQHLINRKLAEPTIKLKLCAVKRLYDSCLSRKLIQANPAYGVKSPKTRRNHNREDYLSLDELKLLFSAARTTRDLLILKLLSLQSLRTIEVRQLTVSGLIWRNEECYISPTSKGASRIQCLHESCFATLQIYLKERVALPGVDALLVSNGGKTPGAPLTRQGIYLAVKTCLKRANLHTKLTFQGQINLSNHNLRHSGATALYAATKDLLLVQEHLGHASPRTTSIYVHPSDSVKASSKIKI